MRLQHPRSLQAGLLQVALEPKWLPDETDVAWEHLALLGRKELAAFSDNIAVFLNSRRPLLETLYKQINGMVRLLSWPWPPLEIREIQEQLCPLCNSGYAVCQAQAVENDSSAASSMSRHETVHVEPCPT